MMQTAYNITPNVVTYNSLLKVVASAAGRGLSNLDEARKILGRIEGVGLVPDTISYNSLLDVCAKTGDVHEITPVRSLISVSMVLVRAFFSLLLYARYRS